MDLSAVSANTTTPTTDLFKQRRLAMNADVPLGDFAMTQANLANIQQDAHSMPSGAMTSNSQQNPWQSTLKTDLSTLTNAVQEGDQGGWQPVQQDNAANPNGSNAPAASTADQSSNPLLNNLANLLNSVVFGVQSAAAALQHDIQAVFGATSTPIDTASITTQSITTQTITPATTAGPSQNSLLTDLQALISAAGSNDTIAVQTAAKNLAQDIQGAVAGTATSFDAKTFFAQLDREGSNG